jgi:hypothetical protein
MALTRADLEAILDAKLDAKLAEMKADLQQQVNDLSTSVGNVLTRQIQVERRVNENPREEYREEEVYSNHTRHEDDDRGLKLEIPEFDGKHDPDVFLEWLRSVERIFEYKEYTDAKKYKLTTLKFTKFASLWLENLQDQRRRAGKEKIKSWIKLRKRMKEKYVPRTYLQDKYMKMTSLKQGARSVEEYIQEFEELTMVCGLVEEKEQKMARFLNGLEYKLRSQLEVQTCPSYDELCKYALRLEKFHGGYKEQRGNKGGGPGLGPSSSKTYTPKNPIRNPMENKKINEVPKPQVEFSRGGAGRQCFKCKGYGHIQSECINKRVMTLEEIREAIRREEEEGCEEEEDGEGEEVQQADQDGVALVLQRVLTVREEEENQRNQLFHTRCTIGGRLCNLIIDSGSCTNVVSTELIEKLKVPTMPHPKPYA